MQGEVVKVLDNQLFLTAADDIERHQDLVKIVSFTGIVEGKARKSGKVLF